LEKVRLAIVGCGVMGTRHLAGFVELARAGLSEFELVATCDPVSENAQKLAKSAEDQLGTKVAVADNLEKLATFGVQAIDVTTPPWTHHVVCIEALQRGWHAMMEKPMGVTIRACKLMLKSVENSKSVLNVAENFHYDPMNLLGRELIRKGVIGTVRSFLSIGIGGGDRVIVTPWRHYKRGGGPLLDVGVHNAYMTEYFMGDVDTVYAHTRLYEKIRKNNPGAEPAQIEADAEDVAYATLLFQSGAMGQCVEDYAAHGQGMRHRVVYGSKGSLNLPGDRSGQPVVMTLDGVGAINNERILEFIPEFRLGRLTAALFGGERIWRYGFPFQEIDRKLLAVEYGDFAESILRNKKSEVELMKAARAVGLPYALLESSKLGRQVSMDEVMKGNVSAYQDDIDRDLGLI
jgi:predicted dehydrogenase